MRNLFIIVLMLLSPISKAQDARRITLTDMKGKTAYLPASSKATVIIFLSPECPLCQSYTPTIRALKEKFSSKGVSFTGVVPGTDYSIQTIGDYIMKYKVPVSILRDMENRLVKKLGATVTPEAFVLDEKGTVVYSGRIDNWAYEVSRKRKVITSHDLENALTLILAGKPASPPKTKAVGCFIE